VTSAPANPLASGSEPDQTDAAPTAERRAPEGTGSRGSRIVGTLALVSLAATALYGLVLSPPDANQGNAARLLYIHVPTATVAYLAFGVTAVGSAMYLWKRTEFWDLLAGASAEVGVVFTGICLLTGMLWGRPIWGVYWVWDARLTTTLLLFVLFLGYLALRRVLVGSPSRAKWSAVAGIVAAIDIPIVHYSTTWWNTLHQGTTISPQKTQMGGLMLFTLGLGFLSFLLVYWWLMIHRFRLQYLETRLDEVGLDTAIAERRAEAGGAGTSGPTAAGPELAEVR
jgi:heme exporter protein C